MVTVMGMAVAEWRGQERRICLRRITLVMHGRGWWGTVTVGLRVHAEAPGKLPGGCPPATGTPINPPPALGLLLVRVGNYK